MSKQKSVEDNPGSKAWSLMESFKELLNNLNNEHDLSHYHHMNDFITREIATLKTHHNNRKNESNLIEKNVSSNVPSCRGGKTHGTHYFAQV